jgi:hypothetical protein
MLWVTRPLVENASAASFTAETLELVEQTLFFTTKAQSRKGLIQDFRKLREFFVSWCLCGELLNTLLDFIGNK